MVRAADQWWAAGDTHRGTSCAFWLAIDLLLGGQHAHSAGWMTTAQRVLNESQSEGAEPGYLLAHQGLLAYITGNGPQAVADFSAAMDTGRRFADQDLATFAQVGSCPDAGPTRPAQPDGLWQQQGREAVEFVALDGDDAVVGWTCVVTTASCRSAARPGSSASGGSEDLARAGRGLPRALGLD